MVSTKITFLFTLNLSQNESTTKTKHPEPRTGAGVSLQCSQACTDLCWEKQNKCYTNAGLCTREPKQFTYTSKARMF